jgi:hypothetical protein
VIALKDADFATETGANLALALWAGGHNFAIVTHGRIVDTDTPVYGEWTAEDAEQRAKELGGVAVGLRGEESQPCMANCGRAAEIAGLCSPCAANARRRDRSMPSPSFVRGEENEPPADCLDCDGDGLVGDSDDWRDLKRCAFCSGSGEQDVDYARRAERARVESTTEPADSPNPTFMGYSGRVPCNDMRTDEHGVVWTCNSFAGHEGRHSVSDPESGEDLAMWGNLPEYDGPPVCSFCGPGCEHEVAS